MWEERTYLADQFIFDTTGGLGAGKETFGQKTFGPDHLMPVEQQMHIFDAAAFLDGDGVAIDQIAGIIR